MAEIRTINMPARDVISRTQMLHLALLMLAVAAVLYPVLGASFVNWDESMYIVNNPTIKTLSWANLKRIFLTADLKLYTPLVTFSYALEYRVFGLDPLIFHATNLLLHVFNTLLVYCLISLMGFGGRIPFVAALLFGIHPMHVESVAWVPERKDMLYAWFYLFASCAYLLWLQTGKNRWYRVALVAFLCSLFSKPMAVTLPAILLLLDYWEGRKFTLRMLAEKIPFALLALAFAGALAYFNVTNTEKSYRVELLWQILLPLHNLFFYLKKMLWPSELSAVYATTGGVGVLGGYALLALAGFAALWRWGRASRLAVFCSLYGVLSILPVLQILKFGPVVVADRYSYLPSLGLLLAVAVLYDGLLERWRGNKVLRGGLLVAGFLVVVALAYGARQRSLVWHDSLSLWGDTVRKMERQLRPAKPWPLPEKLSYGGITSDSAVSMAYQNYATALMTVGQDDQAVEYYVRALNAGPRSFSALSNLSIIFAKRKDYAKALEYAEKAVSQRPSAYEVYANISNIYHEQGRTDKALEYLNTAIRMQPRDPRLHGNLALIYAKTGDKKKAEAVFRHALELDPRYPLANAHLCQTLYDRKKLAEAFPYCRLAYLGGYAVPEGLLEKTEQAYKAVQSR